MFWCQPTLPIDLELHKSSPEEECQAYHTLDDPDIEQFSKERDERLKEAMEHIHQAQKKQKETYDKKHTNQSYSRSRV